MLLAATAAAAPAQTGGMPGMPGMTMSGANPSGAMITTMMKNPMIPGLKGTQVPITLWLPGQGVDPATVPEAKPREIIDVKDGDSLTFEARLVRRTLHDHTYIMYGYNGQYPGPMIRAKQGATITVRFVNKIDMPSTIHWHGVRLANGNDGVPGFTQEPVQPGGAFVYKVKLPDAGLYWYHDHVREDIGQDMGLYGNIMVDSPRPDYLSPVNGEEFLMLDDILIDDGKLVPYGKEAADFSIMGRFGNVIMVNGEPHYHKEVRKGDVVRFWLTNASNARTYNLSFGGIPAKLIAADVGRFENEQMVKTVVVAAAQRYGVDIRFEKPGDYYLTNRVQVIDHFLGEFYGAIDTLGMISVTADPTTQDYSAQFATLRQDDSLKAEIARLRPEFDRPPDADLLLTVDMHDLPIPMLSFISIDTTYRAPVEWTDAMADMNAISTSKQVNWFIRDKATGKQNMDIDLKFKAGTVAKIRITNDPFSFHPMNHPIHFHGQRFLVVQKNGVPNKNMVWRDTEQLTVGETADFLVEMSNPGKWMAHCHIAEHLQSGMMIMFEVQ